MIQNLLLASFLIQEPNINFESLNKIPERSVDGRSSFEPVFVAQEIPAIQESGFVFEFLGCETTPNSDIPLTCEFLVENTQDSEVALYLYARSGNPSRIIDASGNEIVASSVQLGSSSSVNSTSTDLPSKIPLKATLFFESAPEGGIRILDVGCFANSNYFDVEFRF